MHDDPAGQPALPVQPLPRPLRPGSALAALLLLACASASAATIEVNSPLDTAADDGVCTLREAITAANSDTASGALGGECAAGSGADSIGFNLPGSGVHPIQPSANLPAIVEPLTLDALSQPGSSCSSWPPTLLVELVGGGGASAGLKLQGSDSVVRGFVLRGFNLGSAVELSGPDSTRNAVECNFIGTDAAGSAMAGNAYGVTLSLGAAENRIAGNLVSGNLQGVAISGVDTDQNWVYGNRVGTDAAGVAAIPNTAGVQISGGAQASLVGTNGDGTGDADEGNLVSGNFTGVYVSGTGTDATRIAGNRVGTTADGLAALGNLTGVRIESGAQNSTVGTNGDGLGDAEEGNTIAGNSGSGVVALGLDTDGTRVAGNRIGLGLDDAPLANNVGVSVSSGAQSTRIGTDGDGVGDALEANTVSGNSTGISVSSTGTDGTLIAGNRVGTTPDGLAARPNTTGILVDGGAHATRIGTDSNGSSDALESNIVSGNTSNGIWISGSGTEATRIEGNRIGLDAGGAALGNGQGVLIDAAAANTTARENSIAHNGAGVALSPSAGGGNSLRGNSLHSNTGLGIDLGNDGVTPNDEADADTGPNLRQNFPTLSPALVLGGSILITGRLNSAPNSSYALDFYASPECDGSGFGEAQAWLAALEPVSTDANGDAAFQLSVPEAGLTGQRLTATATDTAGNTSELSACQTILPPTPTPTVTQTPTSTNTPTSTATPTATPTSPPVPAFPADVAQLPLLALLALLFARKNR